MYNKFVALEGKHSCLYALFLNNELMILYIIGRYVPVYVHIYFSRRHIYHFFKP